MDEVQQITQKIDDVLEKIYQAVVFVRSAMEQTTEIDLDAAQQIAKGARKVLSEYQKRQEEGTCFADSTKEYLEKIKEEVGVLEEYINDAHELQEYAKEFTAYLGVMNQLLTLANTSLEAREKTGMPLDSVSHMALDLNVKRLQDEMKDLEELVEEDLLPGELRREVEKSIQLTQQLAKRVKIPESKNN